jgi:hypothetical protein
MYIHKGRERTLEKLYVYTKKKCTYIYIYGPLIAESSHPGHAWLRVDHNHPRPFVGVSQKSIFKRPYQVLAMNAYKMAPRTD